MARTSKAWVMEVAAGWLVAFGRSTVVEYLLATDIVRVPRTPANCAGLLIWHGRMIPVIDFGPLLSQQARRSSARSVVLAYQDAPGRPLRHGALLVTGAPAEISVSDDAAGPLEQVPEVLRQYARACFVEQEKLIPILDSRQLFTQPLRAAAGGQAADAANDPVQHDERAEDSARDQANTGAIGLCVTVWPEIADQEHLS